MSDTSSAAGVNGVCATLLTLSVVTVVLRFYARHTQKVSLGVDDWLMLPCLIFYLGACIVVFLGVNDKIFGYATSSFTMAQVISMAKQSAQIQIAWDILSTCALACIKLSAVFFYRRIFCVSGRKANFSIATKATAIVIVLWLVAFLLLTGLQCGTHFSALWDGTYLQYCTVSFPYLYGLVISDLILDVWILALPVPQIVKLHTTRQRKFAIFGVFLLAFIGLGASIARMVVYVQVETAGPEALIEYDEELTLTKGLYFSMLEAGMSLVAVNLPSLWFLVSKKALEASLRSLRSVLSIGSSSSSSTSLKRSNRRNELGSGTTPSQAAKNSLSGSSLASLAHKGDGGAKVQSFEMEDQSTFVDVDVDIERGVGAATTQLPRQLPRHREEAYPR